MSRLKSKEIDTGSKLDNETSLKICMGAAKQIKDSIEQFQNADRVDLVEKEKIELDIIETYLPKQIYGNIHFLPASARLTQGVKMEYVVSRGVPTQ